MTTPQPPAEPPGEPPAQPPAGVPGNLAEWPVRAAGLLIDIAPVVVLQAIFFWVPVIGWLISVASIAYTAYLGHMEGVGGQTPGKAMMGIKLVDAKGGLVGSGPGIGRKFVHVLDSIVCMLGWLLPLVDSKRQTIADKVLDTYVVTGIEKKAFSVELWTAPQPASPQG